MYKVLSCIALILLLSFPASAQVPSHLVMDVQVTDTPAPETRALGEIALTPIGENSVALVLDRQQTLEDEAGFADLIIVIKTASYVGDLPNIRDFGLLTSQGDGVAVSFPRQQLRYDFTLQGEKEVPDGVKLIHGLALEAWIPSAGEELTLDEALSLERARNANVQSLSAGLLHQDPGTGSDSGCALSRNITCHDGSSAMATCPDGCAKCECAPAACACSSN